MVNDKLDNRRRSDSNNPLHDPWQVWPLHPKDMDDKLNTKPIPSELQGTSITPEPIAHSYVPGQEDSKPDYSP